jgi:DNA repair protein RecO (recombination protein O)
MAPPRSYHCEALILRHAPFGEADLLVTFFTRQRGKVRAVARGARRSNSKLVGHLEPLTQVSLSLAQGRGGLDHVSQAQLMESFASLKDDLQAITKGFYLAELVDGFGSEANPNQPLYHLALATLDAIGQDPESELPLRFFELRLLKVSGLMPELYRCVECRNELAPESHRFSPDLGGALCLDCRPADAHVRPLSLRALKVLRLLDRSRPTEIPSIQMDVSLAQEIKSLLKMSIEYWLDKQIQSNSFMEQLHREGKHGVYF